MRVNSKVVVFAPLHPQHEIVRILMNLIGERDLKLHVERGLVFLKNTKKPSIPKIPRTLH